MSTQDEDEKAFEPTPQKLLKAREKGEVARSTDLFVVAAYAGLLVALLTTGKSALTQLGTLLSVLTDQSDTLPSLFLDGSGRAVVAAIFESTGRSLLPLFTIPATAVVLCIVAQRAFVVTPGKLKPKISRVSVLSNFRNKFGRSGLFEFAKSFAKLLIYSTCLALFLRARLPEIVTVSAAGAQASIAAMLSLLLRFMAIVVVVAAAIGAVDYLWQRSEHIRKNRMSRKEIQDEVKESEGDPHMKQQRRQRGQEVAMNRMMADVPAADVVIVNPTHYAVALKWSRAPGAAPVCVAKGVDEIAARIRETASSAGVPIRSDPPTARALHATVEIGREISEEHYRPVAAAIRFAEAMRKRAKERI
ncbi:flagellar biosynthesis protein FlhB [Ruegeria marisrubri]|uniref:Flagellar biosynthesis protein FlhB n=1 Tax=Ruegeria marisrubri TaxID=1685379 RepID=A0A0X3TQD3_9RHOB|nr:flagellar type III secretion system protein FlhB [Ruegeria marisrubri]KUJ77962.1 flagellar biosynthesis protein FlhB [Ruegeria marisrubri]